MTVVAFDESTSKNGHNKKPIKIGDIRVYFDKFPGYIKQIDEEDDNVVVDGEEFIIKELKDGGDHFYLIDKYDGKILANCKNDNMEEFNVLKQLKRELEEKCAPIVGQLIKSR